MINISASNGWSSEPWWTRRKAATEALLHIYKVYKEAGQTSITDPE